jgi:hypothetical protein
VARRRSNPFKGNPLNRLSHFNARPINRDASRVVEPSDPRKAKKKATSRKAPQRVLSREDRQAKLASPKRQLVRKDGTVVDIPAEGPNNSFKPKPLGGSA